MEQASTGTGVLLKRLRRSSAFSAQIQSESRGDIPTLKCCMISGLMGRFKLTINPDLQWKVVLEHRHNRDNRNTSPVRHPMPIKHASWELGTPPTQLIATQLPSEQNSEEMIIAAPKVLSSEWLFIGRSPSTRPTANRFSPSWRQSSGFVVFTGKSQPPGSPRATMASADFPRHFLRGICL